MSNLRELKSPIFSERETPEKVIDWATEAGGSTAVTAAMMMYNTLLENLARQEDEGEGKNE